jgi:2-methylcitrate dehydratase
MHVEEEPRYSRDYLDPDMRSIANAIQLEFADRSRSPRVEVEYPLGHRRRRAEGIPMLEKKFAENLATRFNASQSQRIYQAFTDVKSLDSMPVDAFMQLFVADSPRSR